MSGPVLTAAELDEIRDHALAEYPREACGFVLHHNADGAVIARGRNIMDTLHQRSPARHPRGAEEAFAVDPRDMIDVMRKLALGWRLRAIYHSHTRGGPHFSEEDLRRALCGRDRPSFPDAAQVVIALPGRLLTAAHAYRWDPTRAAYLLVGALTWQRRLDPDKGAVLVTRQPRVLPLVALEPVGAPA